MKKVIIGAAAFVATWQDSAASARRGGYWRLIRHAVHSERSTDHVSR